MHVLYHPSDKELPRSRVWHRGFARAHCCFLNIYQEERKKDMKMKSQEVILKKQVTITVPSTLH